MVLILLIGLLATVIGGSLLDSFNAQESLLASQRTVDDFENLNVKLTMAFSNSAACRTNLDPALFGNSLSTLNPKKSTEIRFPSSSVLLKAGGTYGSLQLSRIFFSVPVQIHAPDPSYLTELTVEVKDGNSFRQKKIPFYFIKSSADSSLEDCFATLFPQPQPSGASRLMTLEDIICRQVMNGNPNAIYGPSQKTCVAEM